MKISDIIFKNEAVHSGKAWESEFKKITFRAENTDEKSVYFHLRRVFSKTAFPYEVIDKRPLAIVTDCEDFGKCSDIPTFTVKDARLALSFAFCRFYGIDFTNFKIIGITGTNGKTTTASMIEEILKYDGKKTGFIGTGRIESDGKRLCEDFYSMTTPDPDLLYSSLKRMENDGCEFVVMEVSSHALALHKVAPITFDIGIFTNISHEHLDFHGDIKSYFKTKMKLLEKSRVAIFNIDDSLVRRGYSEYTGKKVSVGILFEGDARIKEPQILGFDGSSFIYKTDKFVFKMNLPLVGAYNIYNAIFAISAACLVGIRPCIAKAALEKMKPPLGRFEIIKEKVTVIIDYAHTPRALESLLKTVNGCKTGDERLITVFGCGGDRDKDKRPIMGKIAEEFSDITIVTEDNSRSEDRENIVADIVSGFKDPCRAVVILSRKEAIETAILSAKDGDIVAVVGKGAENYNIGKNGIVFFDERKIISEALVKRSGEINYENKA